MNIVSLFDERAAATPNAIALTDATAWSPRSCSFHDLQQHSMGIAERLRHDGIGPGDRVMVAIPLSADLYASLLAVWRLAAVVVFSDPSSGRERLDDCCRRLAPVGFIGIPRAQLLRLISPAVRQIPRHYCTHRFLPFTRSLPRGRSDTPVPATPVDGDAPALITFTSGSTNRPKAASRSHDFLVAQYRVIRDSLALEAGQTDITTLPIFVLANLTAGLQTLLPPGDLRYPGQVRGQPILRTMQRHGVTRAIGSPALFQRLCEALPGDAHPPLQSLHTGGAPVTPSMLETFTRLAPAENLHAVYGSTEAEPIAEFTASELDATLREAPDLGKGLPAGQPIAAIDLRILRDQTGQALGQLNGQQFAALQQETGDAGEIVVSGEHVLSGYLDGKGDADSKFRVEGRTWHRTGDAGYMDSRGRLWLLGRTSSACDWQGRRIYPFELEYPAIASPEVERAAMLNTEEGPFLFLSTKAGQAIDLHTLQARLPVDLPTDRLRILPSIPLDHRHNAKVDYAALRAQIKVSD